MLGKNDSAVLSDPAEKGIESTAPTVAARAACAVSVLARPWRVSKRVRHAVSSSR